MNTLTHTTPTGNAIRMKEGCFYGTLINQWDGTTAFVSSRMQNNEVELYYSDVIKDVTDVDLLTPLMDTKSERYTKLTVSIDYFKSMVQSTPFLHVPNPRAQVVAI